MKRWLCVAMCTALLVSNQAICLAQGSQATIQSKTNTAQSSLTKEEIESKMKELQTEFGLTYDFVEEGAQSKNTNQEEVLHFDTLEEYEAFIRELSEPVVIDINASDLQPESSVQAKSTEESIQLVKDEIWLDTISRGYKPCIDFIYSWRYSNGNPVFDEIIEIYPWVTGVSFGEWNTHTVRHSLFENFARYDGIEIRVTGSISLSIGIGDFQVGHNIPANYTMRYTL